MPRVPAVSKPAAAFNLVRGSGKSGAKAAPPARAVGQEQQPSKPENDKEECPLCVEVLDETDMSFQPCPCGYRVCLFCYDKLKLHNYNCPNCRRGYGSEEAMEYAKQLEAERAQETMRPKAAPTPAPVASTSMAAAVAGRPPVKAAPAQAAARRDSAPLPAAKRSSGAIDDGGAHGAGPSLPSGVTWATASPSTLSRDQSVDFERPAINMDESSWPSLGAPSQPQQPQPRHHGTAPHQHTQHQQSQHAQQRAQQAQAQQQAHQQAAGASTAAHSTSQDSGGVSAQSSQLHRHSPSAGSETMQGYDQSGPGTRRSSSVASSMERVESTSSLELMSQDPPVTPEQLLQLQHQHQQYQAQQASLASAFPSMTAPLPPPGFEASSSYFTAQVNTAVNGLRRVVNVPLTLGGNAVEPYPEAPALLSSLQQGVAQGTVTPKDGSAQLFGLLRAKEQEAQGGRMRSGLAATKPPPGFHAPAAQPPASAQSAAVAPPVPATRPPPPPGFGHVAPAAAPMRPGGQASSSQGGSDAGFGASAGPIGLNANGTPRTYSMWSGLPGMDLAGTTGLTSLWQNLNSASLSLGGAGQPYNPLGLMDQSLAYASRPPPAAPKAPPPGFGPAPAYGGAASTAAAPSAAQQLGSGDAVLGNTFRAVNSYQPVGGARYNPLGQAAMPTAYRPPLGAGL